MATDPAQTGLAAVLVGALIGFARKAIKISKVELRVVDPKNEAEVGRLRAELDVTKEQLGSTRVELAGVRAELLALQAMRSDLEMERKAWQEEGARLREYTAQLEHRLDTRPDQAFGFGALDAED